MKPTPINSVKPAKTRPNCLGQAELFQNRLLADDAKPANAQERRQQRLLSHKAENICLDCPLMVKCLYRAVVECDVDGIVAGTTQRQRKAMRRYLGIVVDREDFDIFAGVNSGYQVNHEEVLRLRAANPNETLESIAQRLGCSLSTVKRHLRKARRGETVGNRRAKTTKPAPTVAEVMEAYNYVVVGKRPEETEAA